MYVICLTTCKALHLYTVRQVSSGVLMPGFAYATVNHSKLSNYLRKPSMNPDYLLSLLPPSLNAVALSTTHTKHQD